LEFDLLNQECYALLKANGWWFMGAVVHCSTVRYAVIQASGKKDRPERLVIAYQDENCLRGLIASPSIIGLGFASREEAMADLKGNISDAAPSKQKPRITAMFHASGKSDLMHGHGFMKYRKIPHRVLQTTVAAAIVLFYSKNLVCVMFRTALGASL
jgi:hypothetical protein